MPYLFKIVHGLPNTRIKTNNQIYIMILEASQGQTNCNNLFELKENQVFKNILNFRIPGFWDFN